MLKILSLRIKDSRSFDLLKAIIFSYTTVPGKKVGMPIGNLTSQIFANIYLNELDRFVKHQIKPKAYARYGDDFILIESDFKKLKEFRMQTVNFLNNELKLQINPKSDRMMKSWHGLKYLGVKLWPNSRTLSRRNRARIKERLASNYNGPVKSDSGIR